MKAEINFMINKAIQSNSVHEEVTDHELIIDGLPCAKGDLDQDEIERVTTKLRQIDKNFAPEDIDDLWRFSTPNDDGTLPMRVTLFSKLQTISLAESARRGNFPWFRQSVTRGMRKHNAWVDEKVADLNGDLPDNSSTVWERVVVGRARVWRRANNVNYKPPQQTVTSQLHQRPDSIFRQPGRPPVQLPQSNNVDQSRMSTTE